ncbi:ArsR/SmtB family transcription factor [Demequina sp.]|uniref:ArsR/SmtB family transcription factor n=1 Tax=Demequina sp. TaxID=2050685 RepID=UPI003D135CC0
MDSGRSLNVVKAELFKGLAHPVRIRILELLDEGGELGVTRLIAETGLEASHVSQHLRVLRGYDLVTSERRGSEVFYRLAHEGVTELLAAARTLLREVLAARHAMVAAAE